MIHKTYFQNYLKLAGWVLVILASGAGGLAPGHLGACSQPQDSKVEVSLAQEKNTPFYNLQGSFFVPTASKTAWQVLTDYNHLSSLVSSMEESKVTGRDGDSLLVRQTAAARFWFFTKRMQVLLKVDEQADGCRINFKDILKKDFKVYDGSWTLSEGPGGTWVKYCLKVQIPSGTPTFIAEPSMQDNARKLLGELKSEMLRRALASKEVL